MDLLKDYALVIDDTLNGFNDTLIDDRRQQIRISPAIFSLLQDGDLRASVLEQITRRN